MIHMTSTWFTKTVAPGAILFAALAVGCGRGTSSTASGPPGGGVPGEARESVPAEKHEATVIRLSDAARQRAAITVITVQSRGLGVQRLGDASQNPDLFCGHLGAASRPRAGQDGIFALNFLVRAASVVNHLTSKSAPVRNRSIHVGGSTEKSILWRPQSGRRPS